MKTKDDDSDWLDSIKTYFKHHPKFYGFLVTVIAHVYSSSKNNSYNKLMPLLNDKNPLIINVGSGPFRLEMNSINVDISRYNNVDIIADARNLPIKTDSVDAIINIAILEHIDEAEKVMGEMYRVLKVGGFIYTVIPFIYEYHASPHDYKRWTVSGCEYMHRKFNKIEIGVLSGPSSTLVGVLIEWLAIIFSFGSIKIYKALYFFFMLTLWPLKYFDVLLNRHPMAKIIACTFYYVGKK